MKKLFALFLSFILMLSVLSGCASSSADGAKIEAWNDATIYTYDNGCKVSVSNKADNNTNDYFDSLYAFDDDPSYDGCAVLSGSFYRFCSYDGDIIVQSNRAYYVYDVSGDELKNTGDSLPENVTSDPDSLPWHYAHL